MQNHIRKLLYLLMLSIVMAGCDRTAAPDATTKAELQTDAADTAIPASLPQIDLAGLEKLIAEADEADQVLVVDFWATWCVPCVAMFPTLHDELIKLGDAVRPATVTLDSPGDYEQKAIEFLKQHDALHDAYLLVPDSDKQLAVVESLGERWNDLVVPAILVFDTQGKLAGEFLGGDQTEPIINRVRELTTPASK